MLEKEFKDITEDSMPAKNLKFSLLALGYSVLASISFYLSMDSLMPSSGKILFWSMISIYYALTFISGVYAFLACRNSLKSLKTNNNSRNYIALVIGGLLLLGICRQVLMRI